MKPNPVQVEGITLEIMEAALRQAADGRRHILAQMGACDPPPRGELGPYTPRILIVTVRKFFHDATMASHPVMGPFVGAALFLAIALLKPGLLVLAKLQLHCQLRPARQHRHVEHGHISEKVLSQQIPTDKIGLVIGPGGRVIKGIRDDTGCDEIQVCLASLLFSDMLQPIFRAHQRHPQAAHGNSAQSIFRCVQTEQDGTVVIAGPDEATVQAAAAKIRAIVSEVEVGTVYRRVP